MAVNDVRIRDTAGHNVIPTQTIRTEAAASDIDAGEPVKRGGTGGNYAIPLADGDPELDTDLMFGIAASAGTHTATADGVVEVYKPLPGVVYECAATTPANVDTDAELLGVEQDRVTFDLATGTYTIDENEGDNQNHGLVITGGDTATGVLYFEIRSACTMSGNGSV